MSGVKTRFRQVNGAGAQTPVIRYLPVTATGRSCNTVIRYILFLPVHGQDSLFESPLKDILSSPEYQKRINVSVKDVRDANPKCRECRFVDRCIGGCREHALLESNHYYGIAESLCRFFEGGWDEKIRAVAEPAYQEYLSRHPELKNRTSKNEESEDKKEERSILC